MIACDSCSGGCEFDPHWVRQHSVMEIDREMFSVAILPISLIQEGWVSVSGENHYWLTV